MGVQSPSTLPTHATPINTEGGRSNVHCLFIRNTHLLIPDRGNVSKTVWGILSFITAGVCVLVALVCLIEYLSLKAEYDQYCTGIERVLVEIVGGGHTCDVAETYLGILNFSWLCCGVTGIGLGILGIVLLATSDKQQQVVLIPQTGVQYVQPHQVQNQYIPPQTIQKPPPGH